MACLRMMPSHMAILVDMIAIVRWIFGIPYVQRNLQYSLGDFTYPTDPFSTAFRSSSVGLALFSLSFQVVGQWIYIPCRLH